MNRAPSPLQVSFGKAVAAFNGGRLAEAERHCRTVLSAMPNLFDARFLMALIQSALGQDRQAIDNFDKALGLKPGVPEVFNAKAASQQKLNLNTEAVESYDRAIALRPRYAEALFNRGTALDALGRVDEAIESYGRAIAAKPDFVEALNNRGIRLQERGRLAEAMESFDRALAVAPDHLAVLHNRGKLLAEQKRPLEAVASYDRALARDPRRAEIWNSRGIALQALGNPGAAIESFNRALAVNPGDTAVLLNRTRSELAAGDAAAALATLDQPAARRQADADYWSLRGNVLHELDRFDDAIEAHRRVLTINPRSADGEADLANDLRQSGRSEEALTAYERALALAPGHSGALYGRGTLLLFLGRYREGWTDFEARRAVPGWPDRGVSTPEWDGSDPTGKTILVHAEQGLGDTIQFCRFLPLLQARGARVIAEVPQILKRLLDSLGVPVVAWSNAPPAHDLHLPMMSLPERLGVGDAVAGPASPYLSVDSGLVDAWRARLPGGPVRIGIAWQGNPNAKVDRVRSVPLRAFAPLAGLPGVTLVSLQKGAGVEQLAELPPGMRVEILPEDFASGPDSFLDTAAVISALDLVVSIDSAVTHLAGALQRPLIVALKAVPEWRWMASGETSPWYPSAQLFRQSRPGDWDELMVRIAAAVRDRLSDPDGSTIVTGG